MSEVEEKPFEGEEQPKEAVDNAEDDEVREGPSTYI